MAAASWLQFVFIFRAFCAAWSSCRVNSPAPLPEGLQQMLQWRRRWRLPSHQLPLLVGHRSPEPRDRSPADRGGHEVSDQYGGVWILSTSHKPDDVHSSCSRHADISSYRATIRCSHLSHLSPVSILLFAKHSMYSEDDSSDPITAITVHSLSNSLIRNSLLPYFVSFFGSETS